MSTNPQSKPELILHDVLERVSYGRQQLTEGEVIDISGMERDVQALCESIMELSLQERENYAAPMETLYQRLSEFGSELVVAREEVRRQIQAMSSHQKANVAYKTADSRDDFGTRTDEKEGGD